MTGSTKVFRETARHFLDAPEGRVVTARVRVMNQPAGPAGMPCPPTVAGSRPAPRLAPHKVRKAIKRSH